MRKLIRTAALAGVLLFFLEWAMPKQTDIKKGKSLSGISSVYGNAEAITQDELQIYNYFLASDQLEGRNTPSRGYDAAALYVAGYLKAWGLQPGGSTQGTIGPLQPYFMPLELISNQADASGMKLTMTSPRQAGGAVSSENSRNYDYGREWMLGGIMFSYGAFSDTAVVPVDIADAPLAFVGNGHVTEKSDPYQGIDVRGKVLVVAGYPPQLTAAMMSAGPEGTTAETPYDDDKILMTPDAYGAKNGALAIIFIPIFQQLVEMSNQNPGTATGTRGLSSGAPRYQVARFRNPRAPAIPAITAGVDLVNRIFSGEKITGHMAFSAAGANTKLDSFELNPRKRISLQITAAIEKNHSENIIAMLEGSDPVLKHEYVILSAHLDHVGIGSPDSSGDAIYNGANDNASGSAALMAIAHAYADGAAKGMRPKRTTVFLWFGGEEKGLWGSRYFNQFPPIDLTRVVAALNVDMVGRTRTPGETEPSTYKIADPGEVFIVGPKISSDDFDALIRAVNSDYQKMRLNDFYDATTPDATHDNLGPGRVGQMIFFRSDQYNFARMGIPTVLFSSGFYADYHRVSDSPDKIDFREAQTIAKTVAAVGWVIANSANPPKLKARLPDQLMRDMQSAKEQGWGQRTPVLPPLPGMPY